MNREIITEDKAIVPVGITVGKPRFLAHLPYRERLVYVDELAPRGLLGLADRGEFATRYRGRLDLLGTEPLRRRFSQIARHAGSPTLVLLCYEKVLSEGEFCHRRVFAEWWEERTATAVREFEGDA